ncbi:hypothetical protein DH2020_030366 [Rehmannia glutinosa]|uniref:Retrotransposon Copia-like N-terminal domain-containing protein n=1 Tax=Rehmannia glutinosa TaxID=99300 RepID=A0ABR0VL06_REHGL
MESSSPANILLPTFHAIPIRLDRNNYSYWRIQILATVKAHGFDDFLSGKASAPSPFIEASSSSSGPVPNPAYSIWIRRDQLLFSWIISSISESMMGYVSRCTTFAELWTVLETSFRSHSRARVQHLRAQLHASKKGELSIAEYILKMQGIADQIHAAGQVISDEDLIIHILNGLGAEFESIVVNLSARTEPLTLQDVQYALQTHEMRIQHMSQTHFHDPISMDVNPNAHMVAKKPFFPENFGSRGGYM